MKEKLEDKYCPVAGGGQGVIRAMANAEECH